MVRYSDHGREIMAIEIEGLQRVAEGLDASFDQAVTIMKDALAQGGKIVVTGVGKNLPIGQKIAATLTSTGSPAVLLHATDAMHGELGILSEKDAVLALSFSGESDELRALIPAIKRTGNPIIALTASPDNFLGSCADVTIAIRIPREACPFNMAPTTSTTATLAVGDALAMTLLEARGFKKDDYARLHPGGAIGRTLLMKARDIMRTGRRVAAIEPGQTVQDAVFAMTEARAGSVVVTDPDRRVLGIFTDGDLRRHINLPNLPAARIDTLMTPGPITLRDDALAVEVLSLFQKKQIDDVIVVDADGRLAGMIDIQDLPKFKIL